MEPTFGGSISKIVTELQGALDVVDEARNASPQNQKMKMAEPKFSESMNKILAHQDAINGVNEVRSVDPKTGGEKGVKLARFDLIPPQPWIEIAKCLSKTVKLNSIDNAVNEMQIHLLRWWGGEDLDIVSGFHNLTVAACRCMEWITQDYLCFRSDDAYPFDNIPPQIMWDLACHYGKGAQKYAARNFEKGYTYGKSFAAMQRHIQQVLMGEIFDNHTDKCPEGCRDHTESDHRISVLWHCIALRLFTIHHPTMDDRSALKSQIF